MSSASRRETRLVAAGIGIFLVSMLLIFAVVARVALYQLNRIYGELERFAETEVSLTRIVTGVQERQSKQQIALERILRLQTGGGLAGQSPLQEMLVTFREHGTEARQQIRRGIETARTAAAISTDAEEEYRHLEELLVALQREHQAFEARAREVISPIQAGERPDPALIRSLEQQARQTGSEAQGLLLELQSFMEETGWELEVHADNALSTIALVASIGAVIAVIFGAYVLFSTFSHMEKRRRVEEALRASELRHQSDLSTLQDSAAELASLGSETEISRYVERQLKAALGLEWAEIRVAPGGVRGEGVTESVSFRGEPLGTMTCGPKRSGEPLSAEERQLLKSLAQQAAVALHNARTIRALREANESLLRTARLVVVGEFAGAVAHGIRNPLAGIRAAAQVAHMSAEGPSADALATVMAESDRLDRRIRSLLDFSRPYELSLRKADLRAVLGSVSSTIALLPESEGVQVVTELPRDPVEREVDPDYLEEALVELSVNALRAMPNGGRLRLILKDLGGSISIAVEDSGAGIPEGARDRVFDLFFTSHPEGTGMGLATVQKIIEAHGGALELQRTGPDGTAFRIELQGA
ncbi:MAG: ATP-binding protein [Myxococcota bacterium]